MAGSTTAEATRVPSKSATSTANLLIIHSRATPGGQPRLLAACREIPEVRPGVRCPTGAARLTPGFLLPARYVIHTVGPVYRDGRHGEPELLASCYRNSLEIAAAHGIRTIAFPAISCGAYGYPLEEAVRIAVRTCTEGALRHEGIERIVFACFDSAMLKLYERHYIPGLHSAPLDGESPEIAPTLPSAPLRTRGRANVADSARSRSTRSTRATGRSSWSRTEPRYDHACHAETPSTGRLKPAYW